MSRNDNSLFSLHKPSTGATASKGELPKSMGEKLCNIGFNSDLAKELAEKLSINSSLMPDQNKILSRLARYLDVLGQDFGKDVKFTYFKIMKMSENKKRDDDLIELFVTLRDSRNSEWGNHNAHQIAVFFINRSDTYHSYKSPNEVSNFLKLFNLTTKKLKNPSLKNAILKQFSDNTLSSSSIGQLSDIIKTLELAIKNQKVLSEENLLAILFSTPDCLRKNSLEYIEYLLKFLRETKVANIKEGIKFLDNIATRYPDQNPLTNYFSFLEYLQKKIELSEEDAISLVNNFNYLPEIKDIDLAYETLSNYGIDPSDDSIVIYTDTLRLISAIKLPIHLKKSRERNAHSFEPIEINSGEIIAKIDELSGELTDSSVGLDQETALKAILSYTSKTTKPSKESCKKIAAVYTTLKDFTEEKASLEASIKISKEYFQCETDRIITAIKFVHEFFKYKHPDSHITNPKAFISEPFKHLLLNTHHTYDRLVHIMGDELNKLALNLCAQTEDDQHKSDSSPMMTGP